MIELSTFDFFNPPHDPDRSPRVVQIYRGQFPGLYQATDRGEIKTSDGKPIVLGGDTLITYRSAVKKIYGKYFSELDLPTQKYILAALETYSCTLHKKIEFKDEKGIINNHQIGNMMPFPSSLPSMNTLRASAFHDYFDRFLSEVQHYYRNRTAYLPSTKLQEAINFQHGYFDFFKAYNQYIEDNLLQDFVGQDLWSVTDFQEYLQIANDIIDRRGKRFTISAEQL